MKKIGLIAGSGRFPLLLSIKAKEKGLKVYAAAHKNETDPDIENFVTDIKWINVGEEILIWS